MKREKWLNTIHSAKEEVQSARQQGQAEGLFAFNDQEFLLRKELRPVRLQLELLKPEMVLDQHQITQGIAFFGSARIPSEAQAEQQLQAAQQAHQQNPNDQQARLQLKQAERLQHHAKNRAQAVSLAQRLSQDGWVVFTGGGPGFMEAANQGAHQAQAHSVSLNMCLPHEARQSSSDPKNLSFYFHYFSMRKMHFLMRARAVVVFPGGFGTLDELFETLTLIQNKKMEPVPIIMFDQAYWETVVNFPALVEEGVIGQTDCELMTFVNSAEEAWEQLQNQLVKPHQEEA